MNEQRLLYVVADHLRKVHYLADHQGDSSASVIELLRSVFAKDTIFRQSYTDTEIIYNSEKSVLSPTGLLQTEKDNAALNAFLQPGFKESRKFDRSRQSDIVNTFSIPEALEEELMRMFPNAVIRHRHTSFLDICKLESEDQNGHQLFADLDVNRISIAYFNDGYLQFINQFRISNEDDFFYYVMLIYHQFELDPKMHPVHVSGDMIAYDRGIQLLNKYVNHVKRLKVETSIFQGSAGPGSHELASRYFVPIRSLQT